MKPGHLTSVCHSLLWKYKNSNGSHSIRTLMTQSKASPKKQTHPCIGHYWACPVTELGVGYIGSIIKTDNTHPHTQREWSSLGNVLSLFCFVLKCFFKYLDHMVAERIEWILLCVVLSKYRVLSWSHFSTWKYGVVTMMTRIGMSKHLKFLPNSLKD